MKSWRVVEFEVEARQEEMAGWLMMQLGANGCEVTAGADGRVLMRATFEQEALPAGQELKITSALDEYGLNQSMPSLRYSELVEEDWLTKWKEGFEPFPMGERLIISPPWRKEAISEEQLAGRKLVVIDPGLAFGTGFHETTRFCLLALQDYVGSARHILDVGSGSGILSIASVLLNPAVELIAVENDPVACKNAAENFALNAVEDKIDMREATTTTLLPAMAGHFDLILANLTYEDHRAMMAEYIELAAPGAYLLFAGVLKEKTDLMMELLQKHGLEISRKDTGAAWTGFAARKS